MIAAPSSGELFPSVMRPLMPKGTSLNMVGRKNKKGDELGVDGGVGEVVTVSVAVSVGRGVAKAVPEGEGLGVAVAVSVAVAVARSVEVAAAEGEVVGVAVGVASAVDEGVGVAV